MMNMKHYHAHIYFKPEETTSARRLARRALVTGIAETVKLHERPVGPHPTGMLELHFNEVSYALVTKWIETHCGMYSVLIHQDTGDDVKDHTDGIRWLGQKLPLDFGFFELIQSRPDLRVNP
jgi:aromatic ring-cleaving dioxygenase